MAKDCSIYTCVCLCVRFVDLVDKLGQIMGCRFWMHTCTQEEEREWSNEWRTELVWTKEVYIALYIIGIKTSTPYSKGWSNEWETELATKDCFGTEEGPNWVTFLQNNNEWEQIVPASIYTSLLFAFCGRCSPKIPERIDRATFRTNRGEVAWGDCAKKTFIFLLSPSSSCTSLSSGTFLTLSIVKYLCVKFPVSFLRITLNIYHLLSSWSFPKIYSLHLYGTHWVVKSFYMDKNFQIV